MHYNIFMRRRKSDGKVVGTLDKRPKHPIEAECYDRMHEDGWTTVTKRGFPDFICLKAGRICLVECKRSGQRLSRAQYVLFKNLSTYGVPCYYYSPSNGLHRFIDFYAQKPKIAPGAKTPNVQAVF